jgi:hypothetical protein
VDILVIGDLSRELCPNFGNFLRDDGDALQLELDSGLLAGWTVTRAIDHRCLMFGRDGRFATAHRETEVLTAGDGDTGELAWFLPISQDDVVVLAGFLAGEWLVQSAAPGTRPERGSIGGGFLIRVGPVAFDLRWNLPFDRSEWPHRLPVLRDAWRIDQIYRFRPLVYFAAFGGPVFMQQFALSLESLVTVGAYRGAIAVLTDKDARGNRQARASGDAVAFVRGAHDGV